MLARKPKTGATEAALEMVAKRGPITSVEIGKALNIEPTKVTALLSNYVGGVIVSCLVEHPQTGRRCNEYRLSATVPPARWRDHAVSGRRIERPTTRPAVFRKTDDEALCIQYGGGTVTLPRTELLRLVQRAAQMGVTL